MNSCIFHAARAPNKRKFEEIMEIHVKPTKPMAFQALMALDRKRWTFYAGPEDTVIGDQTTSNPVEQNMSMIGAEVQFHSCPGKSRSSWSHSFTTILNPLHCCLKNPRQAHGRNELDFCFHKVRYWLCSYLYHRHQPSVRHGMEAWNGAMAKYIESIFSIGADFFTNSLYFLSPPTTGEEATALWICLW